MSAHTPGPWNVSIGNPRSVLAPVLLANRRTNIVTEAKTDADARLMAAAPELLAALETYFTTTADPKVNGAIPAILHTFEAQARAALAKARRGTP